MRKCSELLVADLKKEVQTFKMRVILEKAKDDYYHDFFGVPAFPEMELLKDLKAANAGRRIIQNVVNGKYDASKEDSEEWAKSPEGQETFGNLIPKQPPGLFREPE